MGYWADATRSEIVQTFEAASGDMQGDVEPTSIWRRDRDASDPSITGPITRTGDTLRFAYTIHDEELDIDDVARLFSVAYLDELTMHYYRDKTKRVVVVDAATGAELANDYPA